MGVSIHIKILTIEFIIITIWFYLNLNIRIRYVLTCFGICRYSEWSKHRDIYRMLQVQDFTFVCFCSITQHFFFMLFDLGHCFYSKSIYK